MESIKPFYKMLNEICEEKQIEQKEISYGFLINIQANSPLTMSLYGGLGWKSNQQTVNKSLAAQTAQACAEGIGVLLGGGPAGAETDGTMGGAHALLLNKGEFLTQLFQQLV